MRAQTKRRSGPSGQHKSPRMIVSEARPGQFAAWQRAAELAGESRSSWLRRVADESAEPATAGRRKK